MNTSSLNLSFEPRWRTYLKAFAFLAPPVFLWVILCVFAFPKLKQIWVDADFFDSTMLAFMRTSDFFMQHGLLLVAVLGAGLLLVEWRSKGWWPRYRRISMGMLVLVLNSAVLILISAMLCSAIAAAPGLSQLK